MPEPTHTLSSGLKTEASSVDIFAAPAGPSGSLTLGGYDPLKERHCIMYVFAGGGYGGRHEDDGLTNGCSTIGISKTQSAEVLEQHYPILFERYAPRERSGGAGRTRGGFGVDYFTPEDAAADYGVVVTGEPPAVDRDATERLRTAVVRAPTQE